jgi:AraC family transcriptional regulator
VGPLACDYQHLTELGNLHMKLDPRAETVRIVAFEETRFATLVHRGDPKRLGDSLRQFIEWRRQNHLPPRVSATFNILYDNLDETPPEDFRFGLCAATDRGVTENPFGVEETTIPGAAARFSGMSGPTTRWARP